MATATQQRPQTKPQAQTTQQDPGLLDRVIEEALRLQEIASKNSLAVLMNVGHLERAFRLAQAIRDLRGAITDEMMGLIMPLMNTSLGFNTDKDPAKPQWKDGRQIVPTPYGVPEVRECLIEALLRGAYPVGNEFNIIAGRCYLTKEFYLRAVGEVPGVTDVIASPGTPRITPEAGVAHIRYAISWKRHGVRGCLMDGEGKAGIGLVIRVNKFMGEDAVIGKATRKAYKLAYQQITGSRTTEPDGDAAEVEEVATPAPASNGGSRLDQLADRLAPSGPTPGNGNPDQGEVINPDQKDVLDDLLNRLEMGDAEYGSLLKSQGVSDLSDLPVSKFAKLREILEARLQEKARQ